MVKLAKVVRTSETKKAVTAEHKRIRAERIARQMARSAITRPYRGRAGRRLKL